MCQGWESRICVYPWSTWGRRSKGVLPTLNDLKSICTELPISIVYSFCSIYFIYSPDHEFRPLYLFPVRLQTPTLMHPDSLLSALLFTSPFLPCSSPNLSRQRPLPPFPERLTPPSPYLPTSSPSSGPFPKNPSPLKLPYASLPKLLLATSISVLISSTNASLLK